VSLLRVETVHHDGSPGAMTTATPLDPFTCALGELTQHVRDTHHAYLRAELPAIWEELRVTARSMPSASADLQLFGALFGRFRSALENHVRKEDDVLFPFIERLERALGDGAAPPKHSFGPLALPIEVLEAEHALGDRLLDRMRPVWRRWAINEDAPRWQFGLRERLDRLDADMQRHVHVEDAILFPRTIRLEGGTWPTAPVSL
jgi:regulator of cell morphogenesis and NO signaling